MQACLNMAELSQAEMIERGDDYFEIADAIHPFGDWRLRSTGKTLREAARHLLNGERAAYREMAGKVARHARYFDELEDGLKRELRRYVGRRIWALIERHLTPAPRHERPPIRRPPFGWTAAYPVAASLNACRNATPV